MVVALSELMLVSVKTGGTVSTVKEVPVKVLEVFPTASLTLIVQLLCTQSASAENVMVLDHERAPVVTLEQSHA